MGNRLCEEICKMKYTVTVSQQEIKEIIAKYITEETKKDISPKNVILKSEKKQIICGSYEEIIAKVDFPDDEQTIKYK